MSAHTPTPWELRKHNGTNLYGARSNSSDWFLFENALEKDAARIVQCVNACEGMDDPEKWIKQQKEYRTEMANSSLSSEVDKRMAILSELESLRAERDGLVEALRDAKSVVSDLLTTYVLELDDDGNIKAKLSDLLQLSDRAVNCIKSQTLAKYEK